MGKKERRQCVFGDKEAKSDKPVVVSTPAGFEMAVFEQLVWHCYPWIFAILCTIGTF